MYYRLTYTESSDKGIIGDRVKNGRKPLNIGQGSICNMQLPESNMYEPQVYATILQKDDSDSWYIVRRTDCHHLLVNDAVVAIAQMLQNGDKLSFNDGTIFTELKFETFNDGEYDASSGIVYKKHKDNKLYYTAAIVIALFVIGFVTYSFLHPRQIDLRHSDLNQFGQSVYHVTVDSVYLLSEGTIIIWLSS